MIINKWKAYRKRRPTTRSISHNAEIDWSVSSMEIVDTEKTIFRSVQREVFHVEYHALLDAHVNAPDGRRQPKTKNSRLLAHNPFISSDGLIRVGSRLVNSLVKEGTKFPIILPRGVASPC